MRCLFGGRTAKTACWLALGQLVIGTTSVWAQLPQPRLYSVFPAGCQKGVAVDITLANGVDLDDTTALLFSHPGLKAVPKVNMADGKPVANTFTVTADDAVPPGIYDVRSVGKYGVSNPRSFVVGDRKEVEEVEPNNTRETATKAEVNTVINGRTNGATDIDWFKIPLKQGQRVLMACTCGTIDSKLDGVLELYSPTGKLLVVRRDKFQGPLVDFTAPADGEYLLKLYDSLYAGSIDHFYRLAIHTGPHIDYIFPPSGLPNTTGDYVVFGRNLPGGQPSEARIGGQSLEQLAVKITLPDTPTVQQAGPNLRSSEASVDGITYTLAGPAGTSNPVMVYFASGPIVAEVEPNNTPATSQAITVPSEFVGQFQARGDIDFLTFEAKANQVFWLDVFGERNGGTVDPFLTVDRVVVDDKGVETVTRMTALDESAPNVRPLVFDTVSNDPAFRFAAPADGKYRVSLRDRYFESRGGPQMVYRLAIRPEQPDYRLAAVPLAPKPQDQITVGDPWELVLRKGDNVLVEVYSFRRDGFNGVIDVTAEGLPAGVTCKGASLGPGQNATTLVFSSTDAVAPWQGPIKIVGTAQIADPAAAAGTPPKAVVREARGGTIVWNRGAGVASVSRMTRDLIMSVNSELASYQVMADAPAKIEVSQGSQILVPVKLIKRNAFDDAVTLTFLGQPANVVMESKPIAKGQDAELARLFVQNNAPAGTYTIYLKSQATIPYRRNVEAADQAKLAKDAADKLLAEVTELNKKTTEDKAAADKKVTDTAATAKAATEAKVVADKLVTDTAAAATKATADQVVADKLAVDTDAAAKAAIEAAAKAKEAADKDTLNQDLKAAQAVADKAVTDTAEAAKKAAEAKVVTDKAAVDTAEAAKKAADAKVLADKAVTDTAELAKKATEEKVAADKLLADVTQKLKDVTAAKTVTDKKATDTEAASKPNNIVVFSPSTPLVVTVKAAPATLAVAAPNNGALKRGEKLEVKVTVARVNGFKGPVELSLPLPPGVAGLSAAAVTIPEDKTEGVLVIQAAADATEGQLANLVVHATADFNGKTAVDQPIAINVTK
ncbi:MAG: hypothetical protein V4719_04975 [Planctomycetota bacterium]